MKKKISSLSDLQEILNIKASMNKGISEDLILFFPDTCAISRPVVTSKEIPDPN